MNDLLERLFGLTPQMRLGVYVGSALLLAALYWNFFYSPMSTALSEKTGRVQDLEAQHSKKTRMGRA